MRRDLVHWVVMSTVGFVAAVIIFKALDIDHSEWMDFKAKFIIPAALAGAVICFIALWLKRRR